MRAASGLPLAVQLIAPPWREDLAFDAARRLEAAQMSYCPPALLFAGLPLPAASSGIRR
jgi:1-carboxybiuret hydrolase